MEEVFFVGKLKSSRARTIPRVTFKQKKKKRREIVAAHDFVDKSILSKASAAFNFAPLLTLLHLGPLLTLPGLIAFARIAVPRGVRGKIVNR